MSDCCKQKRIGIVFGIVYATNSFDTMTNILTSWRAYSHCDVLFDIMMYLRYLLTSWCTLRHDTLLDIKTYVLTLSHTSWCYDSQILTSCRTYFWRSWGTFWYHDVLLDVVTYFLIAWYFCVMALISWHHNILLELWHTFWCHDVLLIFSDVMYFFLYFLAPLAESHRSFSNAELSVVRHRRRRQLLT